MLVKTALAMSNLMEGGYIVVGVSEPQQGSFRADGMQTVHLDSYRPDEINDAIRSFAEPPFTTEVVRGTLDGKHFIVLRIPPFDEFPTLCRRDSGSRSQLRRGAIYTRSIHKPETVEVRDHYELREIIERAVDLGIRRMRRRMATWSIDDLPDEDRFREERGAFE